MMMPTSETPPAEQRNASSKRIQPVPSWPRRIVRGICCYVLIPYLSVTVLLTLFQRRLIYYPTSSPPLLVAEAGLSAETARDVSLTTDDGLTLHGWLLKANVPENTQNVEGTASIRPSPPLVLYFPGNAQHRRGRLNDLRDFTRLGCDVLIFDYRGYAENVGTPSEAALASDALAIWRFAVNDLQVDPSQVLLFGESLGGAVAVRLAQTLCQQQTPPAGLVTNATFASLPRLAAWHYPLFPFRWLVWDRWPSIDRVSQITCPLLMFHGTADDIVPITEGRELFTSAPACSLEGCEKAFVEIEGAGHNDIPISLLQKHLIQLLSAIPQG